jgi:PDZ domain-containing secreted protein
MEMLGTWTAYVCGGLIALVVGGLGLFLVIHAQRNKHKAQQSQTWPVAKGTITQTDISVQEYDEKVRYVPVVRYTYQVNEQVHEGRRITFGSDMEFPSRQKATEYLAEYPVGAEVSVYYNPEKPSEAVLQQVARKTAVGMVIGIVLLAVMLCLVCLMATGIFRLITG